MLSTSLPSARTCSAATKRCWAEDGLGTLSSSAATHICKRARDMGELVLACCHAPLHSTTSRSLHCLLTPTPATGCTVQHPIQADQPHVLAVLACCMMFSTSAKAARRPSKPPAATAAASPPVSFSAAAQYLQNMWRSMSKSMRRKQHTMGRECRYSFPLQWRQTNAFAVETRRPHSISTATAA